MIFNAKLSSPRPVHQPYIANCSFKYDGCEIVMQVSENIVILINSDSQSIDRIKEIFFRFFEVIRLCSGYFFAIDEMTWQHEDTVHNLIIDLPIKYQSPISSIHSYEHFIKIDKVFNMAAALSSWEKLRRSSKQTIDVYYTATSRCDLYPEAKISLLLQSLEGFGKLTIAKSMLEGLSTNNAKKLRRIANDAISNCEEFKTECAMMNVKAFDVSTAMNSLMEHFNDVSLRTVLTAISKVNGYTQSFWVLGQQLQDNGENIDFLVRSMNHRNYFAHLTDDKVRFNGTLSVAAMLLFDKIFSFLLLDQMGLTESIYVYSVEVWKSTYLEWLNSIIQPTLSSATRQ